MSKYKEYLDKIEVLSEEDFYDIADLFPHVDIDSLDIYDYNCTQEELIKAFIDVILDDYLYIAVEDIDIENQSLYLHDVESIEDLEDIEQKLPGWTIINRDNIVQNIESRNKIAFEEGEKVEILTQIANYISIEEAQKLLRKYVNEKGCS